MYFYFFSFFQRDGVDGFGGVGVGWDGGVKKRFMIPNLFFFSLLAKRAKVCVDFLVPLVMFSDYIL